MIVPYRQGRVVLDTSGFFGGRHFGAFVTGASKSARAPDGPAGRQAPNSLSTSLQNILPILNDELRNE